MSLWIIIDSYGNQSFKLIKQSKMKQSSSLRIEFVIYDRNHTVAKTSSYTQSFYGYLPPSVLKCSLSIIQEHTKSFTDGEGYYEIISISVYDEVFPTEKQPS